MAYISKKTTVNGVKPIGSNLFGICSTASSTAQKDVTMADFDVLVSGVTIHVYFTHENTATNPTLKVGSTSAVAIMCNGATEGNWEDGAVISFTYNGSNWIQNDVSEGGGETYTLSKSGSTISLTDSQGQSSSVNVNEQRYPYVASAYNEPSLNVYMKFNTINMETSNTASYSTITVRGVGKMERVGDDLVVHNYEPTGRDTAQETVQTIPLGTDDGVLDVQVNGTSVVANNVANIVPSDLIDFFYPIGSYYETSDANFDPNTAWGGTWSLEASGQVHVSAGTGYTIGSTGGEAEHTLTKEESGLPQHKHGFVAPTVTGGSTTTGSMSAHASHTHKTGDSGFPNWVISKGAITSPTGALASGSSYKFLRTGTSFGFGTNPATGSTSVDHTHSVPDHTHTVSGGAVEVKEGADASQAHNNMQPYIAVNRWHRTA